MLHVWNDSWAKNDELVWNMNEG